MTTEVAERSRLTLVNFIFVVVVLSLEKLWQLKHDLICEALYFGALQAWEEGRQVGRSRE